MISFKSNSFNFFTLDKSSFEQRNFVLEIANDPKINQYLSLADVFLDEIESNNILDNAYLVGSNDDLIGYICLFDYKKAVEMHYAVHENYRGLRDNSDLTIGSRIIKESSDVLFKKYKKIDYFKLYIMANNIRSIKSATNAGFVLVENFYDYQEYRKYSPWKR